MNLPNWAAGGIVLAIILFLLASVVALATGSGATDRVQMIYQFALVIAGLIGLPLAIWRSYTAHRQAQIGQKQLDGLLKQIAISEAGQEADRLQKGAELLQRDSLAVRIAGLAILKDIATSEGHRYRQEAIEVMESFLRSRSRDEAKNSQKEESPEDLKSVFRILVALMKDGLQVDFGKFEINGIGVKDYDFSGGHFDDATFNAASFFSCVIPEQWLLKFSDCRFRECKVYMDTLMGASFHKCTFSKCKVYGEISPDEHGSHQFYECDLSNLTVGTRSTTEQAQALTAASVTLPG